MVREALSSFQLIMKCGSSTGTIKSRLSVVIIVVLQLLRHRFAFQGDVEEFAHQIYIGVENNTKSGVRAAFTPQPIVEAPTEGILNCNYSRTFWISWNGNERRFGAGSIIGVYTYLTWTDPNSNFISTVGFSNAHQAGSHYLFRRDAGKNVPSRQEAL